MSSVTSVSSVNRTVSDGSPELIHEWKAHIDVSAHSMSKVYMRTCCE